MPMEKRDLSIDNITGIGALNDPSIFNTIRDFAGIFIKALIEAIKEVIKQAAATMGKMRL